MRTRALGNLLWMRRVVDDFPSAFAFYRRFLTPTTIARPEQYEEYGYVRLWNCHPDHRLEVELVVRDRFAEILGPDRAVEDGTLVFGVEDVDAAVEELRGAGVPIVVEPHEDEEWGTRFAQARDPCGRLIEVSVFRASWGTLSTELP